ncbi:MAG TPA: hypothetical protein VEI06_03560 [Gemmatimonadaceae bacterium]|nr:hypothetical protein [Gemmatimonadaceae bacterium]
MKSFGGYTLVATAIIALCAWVLTVVFRDPGATRAILWSAAIALGVQSAAYLITRFSMPTNVMAGWALGAVVRFVALAVYALAIVKPLGLSLSSALLSLATFFLASTVVEPLFLKA